MRGTSPLALLTGERIQVTESGIPEDLGSGCDRRHDDEAGSSWAIAAEVSADEAEDFVILVDPDDE